MSHMIVPVSGDAEHQRPEETPEGVPRERVDSYTLHVIDQLFPAPTSGVEFLALLLRLAHVKQLSLKMEEDDGLADVAVICVQSIKHLSKAIGWSYESTHKYVVLFCALGLLLKRRNAGMVELHFPLTRYNPPGVDSLDKLIERYRHPKRNGKTHKRLQHTERVKHRFLRLYDGLSTAAPPSPVPASQHALAALIGQDLSEAISDVADLLDQAPENLPSAQRLASVLTKLKQIQHKLIKPQPKATFTKEPGRLSVAEVDSSLSVATRSGRFVATVVDSGSTQSSNVGRLSAAEVDFSEGDQGDVEESTPGIERISAEKVDSEGELRPNVNVITLIESITLNVNMVALFCCRALGEGPEKHRVYLKVFREIDSDAQAVVAALLFVLAHRADGSIRKPPAVFLQRCKDYHQSGIPEEAAALVQRYGELTLPQLLEALRRPVAPPASALPAAHHEAKIAHPVPALPPITNRPAAVVPRIPLKSGGGMAYEEAHMLYAQIAYDRRVGLCRVEPIRLADGTYAVLVDHTLTEEKIRQIAFYSEQEWKMCRERIDDSVLFKPDAIVKGRMLQALQALQQKGIRA